MLFRESSIQGRLVNLRAADDLGRYVRLVSGRLPATCVPAHCEVLRLEGAGPIPSTPALHLIVVGRAALKPDAPIAPFVLPAPPTEMVAQARPLPHAAAVADRDRERRSPASRARPELETFYRSYGWFVPVRSGDIHPGRSARSRRACQRISAAARGEPGRVRGHGAHRHTGRGSRPRPPLRRDGCCSSAAKARRSCSRSPCSRRRRSRRDVGDARRRLVWFGARRWQVELFTLAEAAALAVDGERSPAGRSAAPSPPSSPSGGLAGRPSGRARAPVAGRPRSPASRPPRDRRPAALRDRPRAGGSARPARVHAARRGGGRRDRDRPHRLGARSVSAPALAVEQRDERIPAARSRR